MIAPLQLKPVFKERVWGGSRLQPDSAGPIGEAWVVHEECEVVGGDLDGMTLAAVTERYPDALLGHRMRSGSGSRFPLLIKLLHSLDWLSVQVHPDDRMAQELEGPGNLGKTEAWHVLDADPGARVVYGLRDGADLQALPNLIAAGALEDALNFQPVAAGDTLLTPAGCVHAIGPGLFIYEVQQTSDITYRLYDWNRPASAGRALHIDKGLAVTGDCRARSQLDVTPLADTMEVVTACEYFVLDRFSDAELPLALDTGRQSFHCVTLTSGKASLVAGEFDGEMSLLDTVIVPAESGVYRLIPSGACSGLIARVPATS